MIETSPGYQALHFTRLDFHNDMSWRDAYNRFGRVWTWVAHAMLESNRYQIPASARHANATAAHGWR